MIHQLSTEALFQGDAIGGECGVYSFVKHIMAWNYYFHSKSPAVLSHYITMSQRVFLSRIMVFSILMVLSGQSKASYLGKATAKIHNCDCDGCLCVCVCVQGSSCIDGVCVPKEI